MMLYWVRNWLLKRLILKMKFKFQKVFNQEPELKFQEKVLLNWRQIKIKEEIIIAS